MESVDFYHNKIYLSQSRFFQSQYEVDLTRGHLSHILLRVYLSALFMLVCISIEIFLNLYDHGIHPQK